MTKTIKLHENAISLIQEKIDCLKAVQDRWKEEIGDRNKYLENTEAEIKDLERTMNYLKVKSELVLTNVSKKLSIEPEIINRREQ